MDVTIESVGVGGDIIVIVILELEKALKLTSKVSLCLSRFYFADLVKDLSGRIQVARSKIHIIVVDLLGEAGGEAMERFGVVVAGWHSSIGLFRDFSSMLIESGTNGCLVDINNIQRRLEYSMIIT